MNYMKKFWFIFLAFFLLIILGAISSQYWVPEAQIRNYNNSIIAIQEKTVKDYAPLIAIFSGSELNVEASLSEVDKAIATTQKHYQEFEEVKRVQEPEGGRGVGSPEWEIIMLHDAMKKYFDIERKGLEDTRTLLQSMKGKEINTEDMQNLKELITKLSEEEKEALDSYRQAKSMIQENYSEE